MKPFTFRNAVGCLLIFPCYDALQTVNIPTLHYHHFNHDYHRHHHGKSRYSTQHHLSNRYWNQVFPNKVSSGSILFQTTSSVPDGKGSPSPSPNRKKSKFVLLIQILRNKIQNTPTYFQSLTTKKAKAAFILQALTWIIILGLSCKSMIGYRMIVPTTSMANKQQLFSRIQRERKPLEVPYSTFLDMMENHGKSTLRVDNVIIGKERIGFRVSTPTDAILSSSTSTTTDSSTSLSTKILQDIPIPSSSSSSRFLYTRKIDASPTLIDFLRQQQITFTAASTSATNTLSKVFSSAMVLVYCVFVLRMYRIMMGGGGGGSGGDVPGKLASPFRKKKKNGRGVVADTDEPLVSFDDIRGMDGPKFEVMELVDTLRYPEKYALLGARAPRGLLLEGPPGTVRLFFVFFCTTHPLRTI